MVHYRSIADAADYILQVLKDFIPVNTLFIATNDGASNTILKAFNRHESLIREGQTLPLLQSYCNLVFQEASSVKLIPDTTLDPVAGRMGITRELGRCSFLGVPIATMTNGSYGTICALDRQEMQIGAKEIALLEAMAGLISYVADLENASIQDGLTGLYNRKYLDKYRRTDAGGQPSDSMSLLFIDIDDFKSINDTFGHEAGDVVLVEVASRLRRLMRKTDPIIRIGGDEFIVVMEGLCSDSELRTVAEKLLTAMEQPVRIGDDWIPLSVSIGVSQGTREVLSLERLIDKADQAMYEVKRLGKASYKILE